MSNKQQTAVDKLIEIYWNNEGIITLKNLEQAKEMEKEQRGYTKADIIKAGEMGEINYLDTLHITIYLDEAKQFNERYGGN